MEFTLIDGVVALVILLSGVLAYSRGLVRETLSIAGWVAAAVAGYYFAPAAKPLIEEVPILSDFLGDSCELSIIAAFAGVFALALILISIFTPVFAGAVQRSALGGIDQGLGFLFGILRGALLVIVALVIYDRVMVGEPVQMVQESQSARIFADVSERIGESIPAETPGWFVDRYNQLMSECGPVGPATTPAETPPTADAPAPAGN